MAQYRFIYPDYGSPECLLEHRAHSGEIVTVVRRCKSPDEYEWLGDAMFVVKASDGWEGQVWHSELHSLAYPWPNSVDQNGNPVSECQ